ncbi:trigger factor [Proteocatella sphenisci]|uniref:trigger factor n=1 Tax=Proteocatella sphenisci TaxID=181070 RepID=UPI000490BD47|nr:trigger factor [Proteocatella sphenisci]
MKKSKLKFLSLTLASLMLLAGCSGSAETATTKNIDQYIKLGEYKGLKYTPMSVEVTDIEVESEISAILASSPTLNVIKDRPIQNGDIANIDYEGLLDGTAFEGGSAKGYDLKIGSDTFIPGFEAKLIGVNSGENVDIDISFPEDYGSPDLAGKAVVFKVKVNSIKEEIVSELNEEFVSKNSNFDTIEDYKADIKASLQSEADYADKLTLLGMVVSSSEVVKYPLDQTQEYIDAMNKDIEETAVQYGVTTEEFLSTYLQMTPEEFQEDAKKRAESTVSEELVMLAVSKAEKIKVSDEEYDAAINKYTRAFGFPTSDELVAQYGKDLLKKQALYDKVLNFLLENAVKAEK